MPLVPLIDPRRRVRVVLSSTALLSFMSVRKAAALALAQLGAAAFFIAGVSTAVLGPRAGWFVLAAVVLAAFVRAIDIESWAVFIPGGFVGRVEARLRPLAGRYGRRDGADRAVRSRRARGRRRGALRVRCRRDGHSRAPAHRSPQAGRLRDDARGSDGGAAVDSGARRIGPPVGHDRPRRLDWRRRARTDGSVECGQRGADGHASRAARLAAGACPDAALVPRQRG